jgi:Ca2+-transporting ATPase
VSDAPRPEAREAVDALRAMGIEVVMLTGDNVRTARAVATAVGITDVRAELLPDEKLDAITRLQAGGARVAMVGDGINDAPALRRANVGIAMGLRGTEVAKEAADVVLTDDNFATIVKAIEGGRTIYANIVKFVHFMFSSNLAEVLVIFFSILAGLALPLSPLQILWVNLITDVFPAFALALEPASEGTMRRRPRPPGEALLSRPFLVLIGWQGSMLAVITLLAYGWALGAYGPGSHARTIALFALIAVQTGQLFNCRSRTRSAFKGFFTNRFIFVAVAFVIIVQIAAYFISPLSQVLDLAPLTVVDVALIVACAVAPILITELTKLPARWNTVKAI